MATVAEILARRAERRAAHEAAREEQLLKDLEALEGFELQHGDNKIVQLDIIAWEPGIPTMCLYRTMTKAEFKRFQDMSKPRGNGKSPDHVAAATLIADACRIYPDEETYKLVLEASPGVHMSAAVELLNRAAARVTEEGKG